MNTTAPDWSTHEDGAQVHLERLLGRRVFAPNNRAVGRLEEFRAETRGTACVINDYVIGAYGLFERLGIGVKLLFGARTTGYLAHWDQLDLSDPDRLRLKCGVEQLRRL